MRLHLLHHCVYALHYHLVLVTKYRRKALTRTMLDRCVLLRKCAGRDGADSCLSATENLTTFTCWLPCHQILDSAAS
ncbi:protein of unknown function [Candidatus Methylacidiphilum fumarolicum]|uniref:Transposase IS200-like domain-containing protein n=1 Tax=Candidatus Methylacidiphilum fumarolicum TaxID=591154 RepID=A0ABM9IBW9_9BACT|nr:protein of unknown function [Candidatus Methylacidiphilum fumarolicum]